jgi:hypothetical protein
LLLGDSEVPLELQVLALGISGDTFAVAPVLRIVRRQERESR